jgi:acetolactate synthase-1/2/3 large subunit
MKKSGAEILAEMLIKQGVQYIFGIPGAKIDALFNALLDTPIQIIVCRHEQNAAFMAGMIGRLTGVPGVAIVTSGPGVTNLVTGLLTATSEGDPMIAIGGSVPRSMKFKQSHQAADNVLLTKGATKQSIEVPFAQNIPEIIANAFRVAKLPRSGAVFISIPQDVLNETIEVDTFTSSPILLGKACKESIIKTSELLQQAIHPIFLLGLEASRPENTYAIRKLLKKTHILTVMTYQAAGVLSRDLIDCFGGMVGLFKNQPGDILLNRSDLIVTIGYSPIEYDPEIWHGNKKNRIIHIDYIPAHIHSDYIPILENVGEIASTIEELSSHLSPKIIDHSILPLQKNTTFKEPSSTQIDKKLIHPMRFIRDLRDFIDDDTIVISDVGTHYMWLARYFSIYNPRHLLFSNGQQTLGVALPWAIAAKLVHPEKPVISISGDGGFLFSSMELETAVRLKLQIVHCIWTDLSYNMVSEQQLIKYQRKSAVDLGPIDYVKYAESFGAKGFKVDHPDELTPLLKKAQAIQGPVLLEIPIDYSDNRSLFEID